MDKCIHGYKVDFDYRDKNEIYWTVNCDCPVCYKKGYIEFAPMDNYIQYVMEQ